MPMNATAHLLLWLGFRELPVLSAKNPAVKIPECNGVEGSMLMIRESKELLFSVP